MPESSRRKSPSPLASLVFFVVTVAVTFVLLEACVRVLGLAPPLNGPGFMVPDPQTRFKPRPNSSITQVQPEFSYSIVHNSFGFRDVEHSPQKPPGVFRILGLGDSFTYGVGVEYQDTYLSKLEVMLNDRIGSHPQVEIIKAGIPRYFPELERILLQQVGTRFSPDLVLVGFLPNDVLDTAQGSEFLTVGPTGHLITQPGAALGPVALRLFIHSHLFRTVLDRQIKRKIRRTYPLVWEEVFHADGFHEADWNRVEVELERISVITESLNAEMVLVHIPQQGPWQETHSYPASRLAAASNRAGYRFIDLLPTMKRESAERDLYYANDGHCNRAGYEVIAEALFQDLTRSEMVP